MQFNPEPLLPKEATKLIRRLVAGGAVVMAHHFAFERMDERSLDMADVLNVLGAGEVLDAAEMKEGEWRYEVHAPGITLVVCFETEMTEVFIITGWREQS